MQWRWFVNHWAWRDAASRRLMLGLAVSLALHVVLLVPPYWRPQRAVLQRPLAVSIKSGDARAALHRAEPTAQEQARAAPARKAESAGAVAGRSADATPAGTAGGAPAGAAAVANTVLETSEGELDGEALRGYRLALAVAARRLREVPLANGLEGRVVLRVLFEAGGAKPQVRVEESSGSAVVDEAARVLITRALAGAPLPAALERRRFAIDMPVSFDAGGR